VRLAAARAWAVWEGATSFLHMDPDFVSGHEDAKFALAFARIENHYFVNGGFFEVEDQLLRDAPAIADIPGVIVHGRYDVVCPIQNAWELHKAWPKAELVINPGSGHSAFEEEHVAALVAATDSFA
jgi:proline iminopeptidase